MDLMEKMRMTTFNRVGLKGMSRIINYYMMEDIFAQINKVNKCIEAII